jgi:Icc protein
VTVTVVQISDLHLTAAARGRLHGSEPDLRLGIVLDTWRRRGEAADLVLVTGDDADTGAAEAYRRLAAALATIDAPAMVIAGNHDDPAVLAGVIEQVAAIEVGAWRILGVDSSRPDDIHGTVDADAVAARLDALDSRPTVVAIHHPPVGPSTGPMFRLEGATELLDALTARPHVRAVVSGHLHEAFERVGPGGLRLLGAPSTWESIDHAGDEYTVPGTGPTGARVLYLDDDGTLRTELLVA